MAENQSIPNPPKKRRVALTSERTTVSPIFQAVGNLPVTATSTRLWFGLPCPAEHANLPVCC